MKKLFFVLAAALMMFACDQKGAETITVSVSISDSTLVAEGIPTPESYEVVFTNVNTNQIVTVASVNNVATVSDLLPGMYNVSVSASVSADGFSYNIAGSLSNVNFAVDGDAQTVAVTAVKSSALVFKEIYYTGSASGNYYFRDQFYEIYNNSDQVVYVDSLCICETVFANYDFSTIYTWEIANPEQYVFAQVIWQLPGDGDDYPVKPGESIVIAQWGVDHAVNDSLNPVDLSGAEFEAVEEESTTWTGLVLTDNVAINMKKVVNAAGYNMPQWLTSVSGSRYVLFYPEGELLNSDFIVAQGTSTQAREIPLANVVDAVETIGDETLIQYKGLPSTLDAGYIWCSGIYSGESIARKISTTVDGRNIYVDTNNTTNDFEVKSVPTIRRDGAVAPEWNTWIK